MFEWISLLSSLTKDELDTLSLFCQEREVLAQELLFEEWDESNSMYILKTWSLEVFTHEKILWIIKPWEFVWEMSIFENNNKRSASVRALENSKVIILLSFSLDDLTSKHPEITKKIKDVILERKKQNNKN